LIIILYFRLLGYIFLNLLTLFGKVVFSNKKFKLNRGVEKRELAGAFYWEFVSPTEIPG
jgi:hypothetical protein